jgi:hypothetical protein
MHPMTHMLLNKVGKSRSGSMGWQYILAHGPVGGSHYLISEIKDDGAAGDLGVKVVPIQRLEPYDFYDSFEIAKSKQPPTR